MKKKIQCFRSISLKKIFTFSVLFVSVSVRNFSEFFSLLVMLVNYAWFIIINFSFMTGQTWCRWCHSSWRIGPEIWSARLPNYKILQCRLQVRSLRIWWRTVRVGHCHVVTEQMVGLGAPTRTRRAHRASTDGGGLRQEATVSGGLLAKARRLSV